ncbi:19705_t:CDS:1, partial [Funneliformis geosporum]
MTVTKTRILSGHVTLLLWKIISIKESLTVQDLFEYIVNQYVSQLKEEILETIEVHCSETKEQVGDEIELECIIYDVVNIFANDNNSQPVNAFEILKDAAKKRHLPTFNFSLQNSKSNDKLKLDILSYISSHKGGWTCDVIPTGKKFIRELSDVLWYINKCGNKTFNNRYTIPVEFFQFVGRYNP